MSKTALMIKKISDDLGLKSEFIDESKFILIVNFGSRSHIFVANNSGLNNEVVRKICNDKFYTYLLLKNELNLIKTFSFVDPSADDIYKNCGELNSNNEVVAKIIYGHKFPIVVKANSLSRGLNVFRCKNKNEVATAVENIFNKKSKDYDHVLISQDYVHIYEEYRIVVYDQEIMFAYRKDNSNIDAEFVGNLSPLHWENSKAMIIEDIKILEDLNKFIKPIFSKLDLKYGGLDIARDKDGKLWLIEINTQPGFTFFIRDNSDKEIIKMYTKILKDLRENL